MSWPEVSLGEICKPKQHKTIPKSELLDEGFVVFGANGPIGYYSDFTHDRTTIAITCRGATCGTINVVPPKSYITGNAMALDDLDEERVDLRFLRYALEHQGFDGVINGAAQPQIIRAPLLKYTLPLPPLGEQKRIAAILDQADLLRRLRRCAIDHLNTLGQAIFHEMFSGASINSEDFRRVELSAVIQKGDKINYGVVQPGDAVEDGVPLVRVGDLLKPLVNQSELKRIAKSVEKKYSRSRLNGHEILVACVGSIGAIALADSSMRGFNIARAVARLPVDETRANRLFLAEQLKTQKVQRYFKSETRAVAQPTLNIKQLKETEIFLPPMKQQIEFAERLEGLRYHLSVHVRGLEKLEILFSSLQDRAFQGEL